MTLLNTLLILLVVAEVAVFGLFAFDKAQARGHGWRVRETTLLQASLLGGVGAWLGQRLLRHKTRKEPFRTRLSYVIALHLVLVAAAVWVVLPLD